MQRYKVTLIGETPMLWHRDNIDFDDDLLVWRKDPANKDKSKAGDDRTPAWTWVGSVYHDGEVLGMPATNLMTMLRQGGAELKTGQGNKTYKSQTQAGLTIDEHQWDLQVGDGVLVPVQPIIDLMDEQDFSVHKDAARDMGFELMIIRAKIGRAKHVRVRPMFRKWQLSGHLTALMPEDDGLTTPTLQTILDYAGIRCGLGDWRPKSPMAPGTYGKFRVELEEL